MLNADDPESVLALRQLATIAADAARPIVYWVGAGASRWLGYPSWREISRQLQKTFFKQVSGFDNSLATGLLNKEDYPAIFQMCRDLDSALYYRFMAEAFGPREQSDIYKAFVGLLGKLQHPFVLTTNVDEALETACQCLHWYRGPTSAGLSICCSGVNPSLRSCMGPLAQCAAPCLRRRIIGRWSLTLHTCSL
jgi:hypothetical protein